ncbi:MAG: cob(I)yrinic acid a,c-diamide adenosyltransferase [Bacteroidota bacterium]
MKVYTKTGDKGDTSLFGGTRVPKDHLRIEAYGTVDELNAHLGALRTFMEKDDLLLMSAIQNNLFSIGSILATEKEVNFEIPSVELEDIASLEKWMDACSSELPVLRTFILPGGHPSNAQAHIARTVCRRAERRIIALSAEVEIPKNVLTYVNRLSDFLFVLARKLTFFHQAEEISWEK